jgi:hypothetical protein
MLVYLVHVYISVCAVNENRWSLAMGGSRGCTGGWCAHTLPAKSVFFPAESALFPAESALFVEECNFQCLFPCS